MSFAVGTLVSARGREWVVLPDSTTALLRVRPLGASDLETTAILPSLETVEPASFAPPDPSRPGDTRSGRLLRNAVRLGFRSSAGPFRSLASIAVEPRPYQLVPLLMALRLDPVRLLIADDVGIGKTVEAGLIACELMARGEAERLCVLCPSHLAEQWRTELNDKFHLDAELVLPSTVARLERQCAPGVSVFEQFPVTVVSLDYIKSDRRRDDFLRTCPDLVIADEAHACTQTGAGTQQQRFRLLQALSGKADRHLLLVTATPHSGNEGAFRSLLSLLRPDFAELPADLGGEANRRHREQLAAHFVQRRRADIRGYLKEETPFPDREEKEATYKLHPVYRQLMERALRFARELIQDQSGTRYQQRIRWWSALALLRSISSSPAAAAATLRSRASSADAETEAAADDQGRRSVLDLDDAETSEGFDVSPGADFEAEGTAADAPARRRLLAMAREAEALTEEQDRKLLGLAEVVRGLLKDGFNPIVFCRFIPTAEYLAERLGSRLRGVEIACVTGLLPHDEREARVLELATKERRVLVCTDCLSEGINLQQHFDAVVHADLAWSPTRHEQREGRVDRFNQASPRVRVVTYYGEDNGIDGIVLAIWLKKHKEIRQATGVSVPVPTDSDRVLEAIFEALLLRGSQDTSQLSLFDDVDLPQHAAQEQEWVRAAEREKRSRTLFAQHAIRPAEVEPELAEVRKAIGSPVDLERFVREAVHAHGGRMEEGAEFTLDLREAPLALRDALEFKKPFPATFRMPAPRGATLLSRTHPVVERLAAHMLDTALAEEEGAAARRCGVTVTDAVQELTTLLLLRFRFQLVTGRRELLAEDAVAVAFRGLPAAPHWLPAEEAERLLDAPPRANLPADQARAFLRNVTSGLGALRPHLQELAKARAGAVLASHRRVRSAVGRAHAAREVRVQGEPDILGVYLLRPVQTAWG